jgi:hypothetical protein
MAQNLAKDAFSKFLFRSFSDLENSLKKILNFSWKKIKNLPKSVWVEYKRAEILHEHAVLG